MTAAELREARRKAGLTMRAAAELTGTPYTTWQSWETPTGVNARRTPGIAFAWLKLYEQTKNH